MGANRRFTANRNQNISGRARSKLLLASVCFLAIFLSLVLISLIVLRTDCSNRPLSSSQPSSKENIAQNEDAANIQSVDYTETSPIEQDNLYSVAPSDEHDSLSDLSVSQAEFHEITATRNETSDMLFSELYFNDSLIFVSNDDVAFYSINMNCESPYNPVVRIESDMDNISLVILDYYLDEATVKENIAHSILVFSEESYHIYHLKCTTLPIISIDVESDSPIGNEYVSMTFKLLDNSLLTTSEVFLSSGKIHNRGNTSNVKWWLKKSFRVSLLDENGESNKISLLGLRKDDDYILYSAYNDQEKVRNVFTANLWYDTMSANNVFGINLGNEYRFVELFIDGAYYGLYALGYPIDAKQVKLQADECLFKKVAPDNELTEFIYSGRVRTFELKENGLLFADDENSAWQFLRDFCKCLFADFNDKDDYLKSLSDIDNQIDNYLFVMLIQGDDNSQKNFFLLSKMFGVYRIMECIPWDFDLTWGNTYADGNLFTNTYGIDASENIKLPYNVAYYYIKNGDDEIVARVKERYARLRADLWSDEAINEYIDRYESEIFFSGAYYRDMEKWPRGNYLEEPRVGLEIFREYVLNRLDYFDAFISQLGQ